MTNEKREERSAQQDMRMMLVWSEWAKEDANTEAAKLFVRVANRLAQQPDASVTFTASDVEWLRQCCFFASHGIGCDGEEHGPCRYCDIASRIEANLLVAVHAEGVPK